MKTRKILLSAFVFTFLAISIQPARSQILISILLGKYLNSGAIEFGLTGGLNKNWMYQIEEAEGQRQFHLGFYFDFRLKKEKRWYLYTGCLVKSTMGATKIDLYNLDNGNVDSSMVGGYINRKVNYFQVPIAIKYRFKSNVYALAGVQLGLRNKATDEFTNEIYEKDDLVLKVNTKDEYRRIDAGLTGGFGYKFRYGASMNIGVRYYLGISEIYKGDFKTTYGYVTNSSLYVFAEFPIGAKREARPPREPKEKKRKKDREQL
jgi:hypothetical protein